MLHDAGHQTLVGDEGGYAPKLDSIDEALQLLVDAIAKAGLRARRRRRDRARSGRERVLPRRQVLAAHPRRSPARRRADGRRCTKACAPTTRSSRSRTAWPKTTGTAGSCSPQRLGARVQLVGDDLFVTNVERLERGIRERLRQRDPGQGQPDRHADRDARRGRDGPQGRLPGGDLAPLRRDRGHDDRRPGRRDRGRPDQDRLALAQRPDRQVQPPDGIAEDLGGSGPLPREECLQALSKG